MKAEQLIGKYVIRTQPNRGDRSYMSEPILIIHANGNRIAYIKSPLFNDNDKIMYISSDFCDDNWIDVAPFEEQARLNYYKIKSHKFKRAQIKCMTINKYVRFMHDTLNEREFVNYTNPCGFCKRAEFGDFSAKVDKYSAGVCLASGNYRFPKDEQFKYCPECGRTLTQRCTGRNEVRYNVLTLR